LLKYGTAIEERLTSRWRREDFQGQGALALDAPQHVALLRHHVDVCDLLIDRPAICTQPTDDALSEFALTVES